MDKDKVLDKDIVTVTFYADNERKVELLLEDFIVGMLGYIRDLFDEGLQSEARDLFEEDSMSDKVSKLNEALPDKTLTDSITDGTYGKNKEEG